LTRPFSDIFFFSRARSFDLANSLFFSLENLFISPPDFPFAKPFASLEAWAFSFPFESLSLFPGLF